MIGIKDRKRTVYFFYVEVKRPDIKSVHQDEDDYVKLLKQMKNSIDHQANLNKRRISETTYCSLVRSLLETILMGSSIDVIDGESVPESTKRMAILNQYDAAQFGRRADLLLYESYQSVDIEYAVVSDNMQEYQQVKNIRINATTLDDYISTWTGPAQLDTWWSSSNSKTFMWLITFHLSIFHCH